MAHSRCSFLFADLFVSGMLTSGEEDSLLLIIANLEDGFNRWGEEKVNNAVSDYIRFL